jgi:hypothetical protein
MNMRVAILVISCDKYADLWQPFFYLFRRFWPDCPFQVYLLGNHQAPEFPQVKSIRVGEDRSWSDNLLEGLSRLEEEYIFLFIDDLFLCDYVQNDRVLEVFSWACRTRANHVRLNPSPKPDKYFNELVGLASKGTIYRASTVMSLWKKEVLQDLLRPGENPWHFEIYGTVRSDGYDGFYSVYQPYFSFINGVIKGKWQRSAVKRLSRLGANIDINRREIMNPTETLILYFKVIRTYILQICPASKRRAIKEFLLRGKFDYQRV